MCLYVFFSLNVLGSFIFWTCTLDLLIYLDDVLIAWKYVSENNNLKHKMEVQIWDEGLEKSKQDQVYGN